MAAELAGGLALMRAPFPPHQISKLPKPKEKNAPKGRCNECGGWHGLPAVHLDYVGHAALTDRLLDADPAWTWEPLAMSPDGLPVLDPMGGMWIKLTICGVTRLGYGHAGDKQGGDAIKEVIGDALRNAAMRFGAALDLWHKGQLHVEDDGDGGDASKREPDRAERRAPSGSTGEVRDMSPKARAARITLGVAEGNAESAAAALAGMDRQTMDGIWKLLDETTQAKLIAAWPKEAA